MSIILCRTKSLSLDKLDPARRRALAINPTNQDWERTIARTPVGRRGGPRRIAVVVGRRWPSKGVALSVSFMDGAKSDLRKRILLHMNAWGKRANVKFSQTSGLGQVRIARLTSPEEDAGFWSYVGTEILEIPEDEPTMNLQGFTMKTSEAEFKRVVRHEAGHTLGFDHEHMRSDIVKLIDREKAIDFYDESDGWPPEEVEAQVLTPLAKKSIMGTKESDPLSIMCYHLPAEIMKNGKAVAGGKDINPRDHAFAASLYPKKSKTTKPPVPEIPTLEPEPGIPPPPEPAPPPFESRAPSDAPTEDRAAANVFELVIMDEFQPELDAPAAEGRPPPKFARVFASYGGARVTSIMRLRSEGGEERTQFGSIIRTHERIKKYTNREEGSLPDDEEMKAFGAQLFDTLFQGDVRRLYDEARTRQRRDLDFIFSSMIPWIAEKPWEFAYDPGRETFLATEDLHFTRNVLTSIPADPIVLRSGPLRILIASAQPVGFGRLSVEQEEAVIRRGFEPLIEAGLVEVKTLARATPKSLHGYLSNGDFQIVHFIGHGVYDERRREGCLIFMNDQGSEHALGERSVREIFRGRNLSLVFLNACETGRGGRAEFNKGIAQSLVAHGLPALVANQYSVLDSSATSFAQHFYWSLAQGHSLGRSAREARIAVNYSLQGESIDWAVPVMYARDARQVLCRPPAQRSFVPTTHVRSQGRRAAPTHPTRVAVWDMDDAFPSLARTLEAMDRAQSQFGFELAELSAPLDAWDLQESTEGMFLRADRLARRLRGMPVELGVDVLACITRHRMRDEEWLDIYGWWPDDRTPPILVSSIAGFDQLAPEGHQTDRVIANEMVAGLAGLYGDLESHQDGRTRCPLYFNKERDFGHLVARLAFDPECRTTLREKLGPKLEALEALLDAFP